MWRKDGEILRSGYKYRVLKDGELTVKHAQYNDSGAYECVARTNLARAEAFTELVVRCEFYESVRERVVAFADMISCVTLWVERLCDN